MKKLLIIFALVMLVSSNVFAYNPHTYIDEETVTVSGQRPKVDITVTELEISISADDFKDGIAEKFTTIINDGNKTCGLTITLEKVPVDLNVQAYVDTDVLGKGESTNLNIIVELGDQQIEEDFIFTIKIFAEMI